MDKRLLIAYRYRVEDPERDLLGHGGMGDVCRATDTPTGETVAVKALNLPGQTSEVSEVFARFVPEGEALRRLNHPNIVRAVATSGIRRCCPSR